MMTKASMNLKRLITLAKKHKIIEIQHGDIKLVFHPMAFIETQYITQPNYEGLSEEDIRKAKQKEDEELLFYSVGGAQ